MLKEMQELIEMYKSTKDSKEYFQFDIEEEIKELKKRIEETEEELDDLKRWEEEVVAEEYFR